MTDDPFNPQTPDDRPDEPGSVVVPIQPGMMIPTRGSGLHLLANVYNPDIPLVHGISGLRQLVYDACAFADVPVIQSWGRKIGQSLSVVALVARGHVVVHTDPQKRGYFVDVVVLSATDPFPILTGIVGILGGNAAVTLLERPIIEKGIPDAIQEPQ